MQCIVHLLFIYICTFYTKRKRIAKNNKKFTCCYTRIIHQCLNQPYQIFCQKFAGKSANEWSCRTNSALIVQVTADGVSVISFQNSIMINKSKRSLLLLLLLTLIFNVHAVALHFHTALLLENLKKCAIIQEKYHKYGPDIFSQ